MEGMGYYKLTLRGIMDLQPISDNETWVIFDGSVSAAGPGGALINKIASAQMKDLPMEERLAFMKNLLADEGFNIEWEKSQDGYHIHEISCPYLQIGQSHPEVCTVDQTLISRMLAVPAEKIQCILSGDAHCTYVVQTGEPAAK